MTEQPMFWQEASNLVDDAVSEELFAGPWNTAVLVTELAGEISIYTDNARRLAFLAEAPGAENMTLCRGDVCRMLAARGVTLSRINRRKS